MFERSFIFSWNFRLHTLKLDFNVQCHENISWNCSYFSLIQSHLNLLNFDLYVFTSPTELLSSNGIRR